MMFLGIRSLKDHWSEHWAIRQNSIMEGISKMIADKPGFWFLIERDENNPNIYYYRIVRIKKKDVGKEFNLFVIHAKKVPTNPFSLSGVFEIMPIFKVERKK